MNEKVAKVLRGFINLTDSDKIDFINDLNKYQRGDSYDKNVTKRLVEERSSSVGPKDSVCTCCGR